MSRSGRTGRVLISDMARYFSWAAPD